ncbi:hypothetical protein M3Y96_00219200 [Aphelenchoides besseyi]|nr:hypothetical protein M3Y96_00219200 [Aphelenchoides besseyi]
MATFTRRLLIYIIVLLFLAANCQASLCVVTRWSSWSLCLFGSNSTVKCGASGLQVRNRAVLSPPFPEADGRVRECPHLYEVRTCQLTECPTAIKSPLSAESDVATVDPLIAIDFPRTPAFRRNPECKALDSRCCRITRTKCSTNNRPQFLVRWYRLPGDPNCRSYRYSHCDSGTEFVESPLTNEKACLDTCFSALEKAILPTLRVI